MAALALVEVARHMSEFPTVKITGGPHSRNLETRINGELVPKLHRVELVLDVNDVARVKLFQLVTADVEVEAAEPERLYTLRLFNSARDATGTAMGYEPIDLGEPLSAATIPDLLRAAADRLEASDAEDHQSLPA